MMTTSDGVADAIDRNFTSPNVPDSNLECANVVDALASVASAIRYGARHLGNAEAATPMGALEAHGAAILDAAKIIAGAITDLAEAVRDTI